MFFMTVPPLELNARNVARSDRGFAKMDGFLVIHVAMVVKKRPAAARKPNVHEARHTGVAWAPPAIPQATPNARTVERLVTA
jgi:hypothetical protein